jgi:uncharacterized protein YutE (UPF0331/DUF86 family)
MKNWKTATMGLFLLGVGLVHARWPQRLAMDWPSVALIFGGILFFFAGQLGKWLPYLKRLKIGEAEIELQEKLGDLRENIKELDEKGTKRLVDATSVVGAEQADLQSKILDLSAQDREAALIRLSIEIEKELARLSNKISFKDSVSSWRKAVDSLLKAQVIEEPLGDALLEFRDVRNQVIHSGLRRPVKQQILLSAIDDGLIILRHLKALN